MSWPHRIGAIIQVLTGQIKPPHSVPDTCSKLATCALFLVSAAASFVFFLPIGAMLLVIGLRQGVPASVDSYEEMSVDDPGSERVREADQLSRFGPVPHLHKGKE
jgi:hypothetical protein